MKDSVTLIIYPYNVVSAKICGYFEDYKQAITYLHDNYTSKDYITFKINKH